jgi:hypothetical protein
MLFTVTAPAGLDVSNCANAESELTHKTVARKGVSTLRKAALE